MQASSRLKPVPLVDRVHPVGLAVGLTTETRAFGRAVRGTLWDRLCIRWSALRNPLWDRL